GDVAPLRTLRADGVRGKRVVPRPRLEAVVARGDGADGAHVHQVARKERVQTFFLERRDLAAVSAVDDVDLRVAVDIAHEADAPRAENAAVAVQHQGRSEVDVGLDAVAVELAAGKLHPALLGSELIREILQRTLAALVAHRAIKRVVDEQEFEDAGARLDDFLRPGGHHHAVGAHGRARRLQLRHLLDLDDADAAGAVDADTRVIAVVGDLDPALDGGLQDGLAFGDGYLPAVNRQRHGLHKSQIISRSGGRDWKDSRAGLTPTIARCREPDRRSDLLTKRARWPRPASKGAVMATITPFLWFDTQAEEAMQFYASVFKNSKIISVNRAQGRVMSGTFELEGQRLMALNAGPQ